MGKVITIDGPSGAGKSTMARTVADRLGFSYLDTGALYRAVALGLREKGVEETASDDEMRAALKGIGVRFSRGATFLNNKDVSDEIRTTEAGHYSSVFSARRPVREALMEVQRGAAKEVDLVAEGRDMGTVVFPNAWRKFYLDASAGERARRRFEQLKEKGMKITFEEALADVEERDLRDSQRDIAPLRPASGAVMIDSTGMTKERVIEKILEEVRR